MDDRSRSTLSTTNQWCSTSTFFSLSTEALPSKGLETPLNASATAGCQEQNSSPMVIGTILKSADRQVAGLINTAEGILSALFSTGSKKWKFDPHARRRSALPEGRSIRSCLTRLQHKRWARSARVVRVPTGKTGSGPCGRANLHVMNEFGSLEFVARAPVTPFEGVPARTNTCITDPAN
jgi:hypothetical protein